MNSTIASIDGSGSPLVKLERVVQAALLVRAFNVSVLTLFLWDVILNLGREISIVWNARLTVIKCLYLINRYLAPVSMTAHIWTFSGLAEGLTDTKCRIIYSFASVAELLSISFVSLVIAIRLYAVHELSSRALYILISFWFLTFVTVSALTIPNLWLRLGSMHYSPSFNVCALGVSSNFWTQLLPQVFEHGALCIFLTLNAMSTPRSAQTAMLAILYYNGILYYAITFTILLATLLSWRFLSPLYIGMTAYSTGLLLTLAASHLLLNMGSSHAKPVDDDAGPQRDDIPLTSYAQSVPFEKMLRYHRSQGLPDLPKSALVNKIQPFDSFSRSSSRASSLITDEISVKVQETYIRKRAWWLFGAEYSAPTVETRVTIDRFGDIERPDSEPQTMKVSRLGRFDSWL